MSRSTRLVRRIGLPVLLAALLMVTGARVATPAAADSAIASFLFKAAYAERLSLKGCIPEPVPQCIWTGTGAGYATLMGIIREVSQLTFAGTLTPPASCVATTVTTTFTDAAGEQLDLRGTGTSCPTAQPDVVVVSLTYTVTGGTGRFMNASGGGQERGLVFFVPIVPPIPPHASAFFTVKGALSLCKLCE